VDHELVLQKSKVIPYKNYKHSKNRKKKRLQNTLTCSNVPTPTCSNNSNLLQPANH